jgi:hypothetical protein
MTRPRCTATTKKGTRCKKPAAQGTDPPLCPIHAGTAKVGAPPGNKNAEKHGYYATFPPQTPEERIADLKRRRHRLSRYLDENESKLDPLTYAKLTEMLSRLDGRIIQHEKHLAASQGPVSATKHDLDQALDAFW